MTHDAGVAKQHRDVVWTELGNAFEVELGEGAAEGLPLTQDRQPGESGLKPLETQLLEQAAVV